MKVLLAFIAIATFLPALAKDPTTATAGALCFDPAHWVGRYPAEPARAGGQAFLDLPCVQRTLRALLPASQYKAFRDELSVDSPIEEVDRYLVVSRCQTHNCPGFHAMALVDLHSGEVIVGVYRRTTSVSSAHWYWRQTDPQDLPRQLLEAFSRRHTPR